MDNQHVSSPRLEIEIYEKQDDFAAGAGETIERMIRTLNDDHLETVVEAINTMQSKLQKVVAQADSYDVTFGLQLSGQAKAVIVSASAQATFTIRIAWKADSLRKTDDLKRLG